jgi:hypothetical protein
MRKHSIFLSPAGAGIAVICFFLPWIKASCGPITVEANGVRIGGIFWLVLAAAVLTLVLFAVFWKLRLMGIFKLASISCAAIALGTIIYKFVDAFAGNASKIDFSEIGSMLRIGAFGTLTGLAMIILGAVLHSPAITGDTEKQEKDKPLNE